MNSLLNFKVYLLFFFVLKFLIGFFCFGLFIEGNLMIGLIFFYFVLFGNSCVFYGKFYVFVIIIVVDNINKDFNFLFGICFRFVWDDLECLEEKLINVFIS